MRSLKALRFSLLLLIVLLAGCATTSYRILFQDERVAEFRVSPNRVLLECEDLYDADIKGLYGFMMHVLDNKEKVFTLVQGNTLGKSDCNRRIRQIGKILHEGKEIYIAGRGSMKPDPEIPPRKHIFPGKGTFENDGAVLGFVAIANEHGLCYDAYGGLQEKPCPPEPFPFWNKK